MEISNMEILGEWETETKVLGYIFKYNIFKKNHKHYAKLIYLYYEKKEWFFEVDEQEIILKDFIFVDKDKLNGKCFDFGKMKFIDASLKIIDENNLILSIPTDNGILKEKMKKI